MIHALARAEKEQADVSPVLNESLRYKYCFYFTIRNTHPQLSLFVEEHFFDLPAGIVFAENAFFNQFLYRRPNLIYFR